MAFAASAVATLTLSTPLLAEPKPGIAMHGEPKYGPGFPHLNYVNPDARKGGTLRLAVLGSFDSMNPYIIKGSAGPGLREYVHESLMARSYDEPFSLYGLLAETIDTPDDRSFATFQLRPEARFSNGASVTPDDVIFSWSLLKAKGRPFHRNYYSKVRDVEKVGERGVKFVFTAANDREMPLIVGLMPILPRSALSADTFDKTSFEKFVGSGPYIVESVEPGASIAYRRNPDYWGRDLPVNRGQANFEIIRYDFYRDSTSMMEAFRKGLFDVQPEGDPVKWAEAYDFPAERAGLVKKMEFDIKTPAGMNALAFNTRRPVFSDSRVREALTMAFDFEWLNKTLFRGLYARTESFFDRSELSSAGVPADAHERQLLAPFERELAPGIMEGSFRQPESDGSGANRDGRRRAIALLDQAGYELREGVMTNKTSGAPLGFDMLCTSREQERIMLAYTRSLSQIGVTAQIHLVDPAQFQRRLTSFDYDMIQTAWQVSLSPGNEQNFRWSRASAAQDGSFNYAGVSSEAVDAMIAAMLSAQTREDFVSAVHALDRVLLSGRYVIPLYHTPKQWIAAWSHLRQPQESTLYGARLETWWEASPKSAASP